MPTMEDLKIEDVATYEVKSLVDAYLHAKAYAEIMRKEVDIIHKEILTECPIYADRREGNRQLFESKEMYLCSDENLIQDFYAEANKRLLLAKLKPDDMEKDHCPALVAEHLRIKTEWALIAESGKPFGITNNKLLCTKNGLETRQGFIDLIVGMVVNCTDQYKKKGA